MFVAGWSALRRCVEWGKDVLGYCLCSLSQITEHCEAYLKTEWLYRWGFVPLTGLDELCNVRSQNRDPVYLLSSRLSPFKQICSRREGENASSLLLASENLFGRYRVANFPLTLSALWLSSPWGSTQFYQYVAVLPSTTADVCMCIKDEGGWSPSLTLKSKATQGTEGRDQGSSCKREQSGACKQLSS